MHPYVQESSFLTREKFNRKVLQRPREPYRWEERRVSESYPTSFSKTLSGLRLLR